MQTIPNMQYSIADTFNSTLTVEHQFTACELHRYVLHIAVIYHCPNSQDQFLVEFLSINILIPKVVSYGHPVKSCV